MQSDIAERTAEALRLELVRADASDLKRRPTANPAAYDLYLRGLVASRYLSAGGLEKAVRSFEQATALDPTFAEAFAAWANLYVGAAGDYLPFRSIMPRARELARQALELDADSSDAHATLGNIALQFDHDWETAETELRRAIALNPSNITAHRLYGLLLGVLCRFEEAKDALRRAIRLDPGGDIESFLAWIEIDAGEVAAAIEDSERARGETSDSLRHHIQLGLIYARAGLRAQALREADTVADHPNDEDRFDLALLNALLGRPEAAREVAAAAERGEAKSYTSAAHLAMLYAALGERSRALDLLEQDDREGDQVLWLYHRGQFFDSIRDDPPVPRAP